jgi:hypothetical protein
MSVLVGMLVLQAVPPLPHWTVPELLDTEPLPLTLTDRVWVMGSGPALSLAPPPQAASIVRSTAMPAAQPQRSADREEVG